MMGITMVAACLQEDSKAASAALAKLTAEHDSLSRDSQNAHDTITKLEEQVTTS